ncbi:polyprenyl synthetase family protein [Saccharibacillus kuerlensis]|uniref:Heptaprenyl diphosphate synthase component II n=1 Tax=Saccharibacillus kuerlensis TaxID=459527 RepID=A0ABQ2L231_9BACL|nr:polyprenyl synthetase family protein [Saccharibacillus kuerlensis]GGN99747.1 heptaprenyl diphosphate synthase component II [Saccharibacillus kuerlensis]
MELHKKLRIDLRRIEREMKRIVKYDNDVPPNSELERALLRTIEAGGKRLRPMLVLVGSRFGKRSDEGRLVQLAAAAEFIHTASLIHDDLIDRSPLRRGEPSLHTVIGPAKAVYVGNYMSARVVELLANAEHTEDPFGDGRQSFTAAATAKLCLGEYEQLEHAYDYNLSLDDYLLKSRNKTAHLIAVSLEFGARAAGAPEEISSQLYTFGEHLGLSFQLRDDLLDFTSSAEQIGKPAGSDLLVGQVTLPILYALEDPVLAAEIRSIGPTSLPTDIQSLLIKIRASDVLQRAETFCETELEQAREIARSLKNYAAYQDLLTLADYFGERKF